MTILSIVISFLLDGILSAYVTSPWIPLLTLTTLILNVQKMEPKTFYITAFIIGICYDITYTNTRFLNTFFFIALPTLLQFLEQTFPLKYIQPILSVFIGIIMYRTLTYLYQLLLSASPFSYTILLTSITSSLLCNLIYTFVIVMIRKRYTRL